MKFFDNKEDVIDIQFTQYGKYLLSQGKFRPEFYSFSDEGILYDAQYGGFTEAQYASQARIKEKTIYLTTQPNIGSIEQRDSKALAEYITDEMFQSERSNYEDYDNRHFVNMLGTSDPKSDKNPAWQVYMLQGELTGSELTITGSEHSPEIPIPQLNMKDIVYRTDIGFNTGDVFDTSPTFEDTCFSEPLDFGLNANELADGRTVFVNGHSVIVEITELNALFGSENFDMEIFQVDNIVQKVPIQGGGETPGVYDGKELLTPLSFIPNKRNIVDGILIDEKQRALEQLKEEIEINETYAEHYFEISIDDEIDERRLCQLKPRDLPTGLFSKRVLNCEDEESSELPNIYESNVSEDDIEEC